MKTKATREQAVLIAEEERESPEKASFVTREKLRAIVEMLEALQQRNLEKFKVLITSASAEVLPPFTEAAVNMASDEISKAFKEWDAAVLSKVFASPVALTFATYRTAALRLLEARKEFGDLVEPVEKTLVDAVNKAAADSRKWTAVVTAAVACLKKDGQGKDVLCSRVLTSLEERKSLTLLPAPLKTKLESSAAAAAAAAAAANAASANTAPAADTAVSKAIGT